MRKSLLFFSLLLLFPLVAAAGPSRDTFSPEKGLNLNSSFAEQREAIIQALGDGKTYSEIRPQDRQTVRESLDRISAWLDGAQSVQQLPEETKVRLFNEQEKINTLLTKVHADSRQICRRERVVGSNRPVVHCMTVAERRRLRDQAQDDLRTRQIELANESN